MSQSWDVVGVKNVVYWRVKVVTIFCTQRLLYEASIGCFANVEYHVGEIRKPVWFIQRRPALFPVGPSLCDISAVRLAGVDGKLTTLAMIL